MQNRAEYNVSAARAKAALTLGVLVFSPNSDRRISSCSFSGRESEFISLSATQVSESRLPAQGFAIDARAAQVTNHSDAGCDAVAALRHALKSGYFPEELDGRNVQISRSGHFLELFRPNPHQVKCPSEKIERIQISPDEKDEPYSYKMPKKM